ncbi:hypothetical protein QUB80_25995 [Chlorogloeopsis sp. ULAP01]|nr:hypothetical protein [Chlorogloeopsis sp. ULAP01]MDM9384132.1 hypothetical protein [Chlorogloeopsis sp. ULAP01]
MLQTARLYLLPTVREAARPCGASAVVSQRALAALPTCSDWRKGSPA